MPGSLIRIFSDLHYGDRASRVHRLAQLRPLLDGVTQLVLNGDTLDTRPGPLPAHTAECRAAVAAFFPAHVPATAFLTGNHDADFSAQHYLDLAHGNAFAIHGDIFFEDLVPWSADVPFIQRRMAEEFRALAPELHHHLDHRLALFRRVAASIPQRHQSEKHGLKYVVRYLADTAWPPLRMLSILRAWHSAPRRAGEFAQRHRPRARFIVTGHTHRPGVWRLAGGITLINTGSFCPPLGGTCVDLRPRRITVRQIEARAGEFHPGRSVAEFPLAEN